MANANMYCQQAQFKIEDYSRQLNKRKRVQQENLTPITAQTKLDRKAKKAQKLEPAAKRRQTKALFRPWLQEDDKRNKTVNNKPQDSLNSNPNHVFVYPQSNKQSPIIKQPRRNRQHLIELIKRYNEEAQHWLLMQQKFFYHQQQHRAALMSQNLQQANYQRHLQQMALQSQGQVFLFGHH